MKNTIIDIRGYKPQDAENYLFDANIWLSICCPMGDYDKKNTSIYSAFLKAAIDNRAKLIICSLVLAEVVNRWFRIEFNILHETQPTIYSEYKRDFRGNDIYKEIAKEIKSGISNQILKVVAPIDDGFSKLNIEGVLSNIASTDFNDLCHAEIAKRKNLVLVTNDRDFVSIGENIKILTANNKMVRLARNANIKPN
jgi:predicted nucleic acid-binding protein